MFAVTVAVLTIVEPADAMTMPRIMTVSVPLTARRVIVQVTVGAATTHSGFVPLVATALTT